MDAMDDLVPREGKYDEGSLCLCYRGQAIFLGMASSGMSLDNERPEFGSLPETCPMFDTSPAPVLRLIAYRPHTRFQETNTP